MREYRNGKPRSGPRMSGMQPQPSRPRGRLARPALVACVLLIGASLLRGQIIFQGGVVGAGAPQPGSMPVYVDFSPTATDMISQAGLLVSQQRESEAVTLYQKVMDEYALKLMPHGAGAYWDTLHAVRALVASQPNLLRAYVQQTDPVAQRLLGDGPDTSSMDLFDAPRIARWEEAARRYWLCPAGLEASLRCVSVYLERGDATDAHAVLCELARHPSLDGQQVRYAMLMAATGQMSDSLQAISDHTLQGPWSPSADPVVVDPVATPLWTTPLPSASAIVNTIVTMRRGRGGNTQDGMSSIGKPVPMAMGDAIYINDTQTVSRLDRYSGRRQWLWPETPVNNAQGQNELAGTFINGMIPDQRGVAVAGGRVVAVVGQASRWAVRQNDGDAADTTLVCLDQTDGKLLWARNTGDLDPALNSAYFQGTPWSGYDRVYVILRRNQVSGFQDAYAAAVSLRDGSLIWKRHIAGAASRGQTGGNTTQVRVVDGRLYLWDPLGAAACLDGRTGAMLWLTVDESKVLKPEEWVRGIRGMSGVDDINPPILTRAGLIVPSMSEGKPAWLMDPSSGRIINSLDAPGWITSNYLLDLDGDVLAVGPTVYLFDGKTLAQKWKSELPLQLKAGSFGLAAASKDAVYIPTKDRLVAVRRSDGAILTQTPLEVPGNLLVLEQQIVIAGAQSVAGFMAWPSAYTQLATQIKANPTRIEPGLTMAHVALTARQSEAVLEGVDAAMSAYQNRVADRPLPDAQTAADQHKLLKRLLEFVAPNDRANTTLRRAILDRTASITASPADEAYYHLSLAQLLTDTGQVNEAVDHLQSILVSAPLSDQVIECDAGNILASTEARRRLQALVERFGNAIYTPYDALAAQKLTQLSDRKPLNIDALIEVANQYPLSRAAPAALYLASEELAKTDRAGEAIVKLRLAYRMTQDDRLTQRIVGRLVELYDAAGLPRRAAQWIERLRRDHPGVLPIRSGQEADPDLWLADLALRKQAGTEMPTIKTPFASAAVMAQSLVVPLLQDRADYARQAVATASGGLLRLLATPGLDEKWSMQPEDPAAMVLWLDDEQLLLWSPRTRKITGVNTHTGAPLWPDIDTRALLNLPAGDDEQDNNGWMIEQQPQVQVWINNGRFDRRLPQQRMPQFIRGNRFVPFNGIDQKLLFGDPQLDDEIAPTSLVALNDQVIVIAYKTGQIVAIDRDSGQPLWNNTVSVDLLRYVLVGDESVVALGRIQDADGQSLTDTVWVLDILTGEQRFARIEDQERVNHLCLTQGGTLFYATNKTTNGIDSATGKTLWQNPVPNGDAPAPDFLISSKPGTDNIAWQDRSGSTVIVQASTGKVLARRVGDTPRLNSRQPAMSIDDIDGCWVIGSNHNTTLLNADGSVLWRDAIADPVTQLDRFVTDQYVVILTATQTGYDNAAQQQALQIQNRPFAVRQVPVVINGRRQMVQMQVNIPPNGVVNGAVLIPGQFDDQSGQPLPNKPGQWRYKLYTLDRKGGAIVSTQQIDAGNRPIAPGQACLINNNLMIGCDVQTIRLSSPAAPTIP
ncbi:MAG: PQQ-binding-like beta-propeller repeat protein [Phycisphaera sp.]|nr:PQQ-binding-like beta-propeller repeat protein [Phycisphaera sp.]